MPSVSRAFPNDRGRSGGRWAERTINLFTAHTKGADANGAPREAGEGIVVFDNAGRLVFYNRCFLDVFRIPEDAAIAATGTGAVLNLVSTNIEDETRKALGDVVAQVAGGVQCRHRLTTTWGTTAELRGEPMSDGGYALMVREVSEQVSAEQALGASEARFRDFADAASDWYWETGPDLCFTWASDVYYRTSGFGPEHVIGRSRRDLYNPQSGDRVWERHLADLEARRSFRDFRYRSPTADGQGMIVSVSGVPYYAADGSFLGYRGACRDITAEVNAEEEARRQHARLVDVVDSFSAGFALFDADDRLVLVNDHFRRALTGVAPLLVPGTRFEDLLRALVDRGDVIPPDGSTEAWLEDAMMRHRLPGCSRTYKTASHRWVEVNEYRTRDGGTAVVRTDVTDRKVAEARTREATERARLAFELSPDAIGISRLKDGVYVEVNAGFAALTGYNREEAIGSSAADLGLWYRPEQRRRLALRLGRTGEVANADALIRRKDGAVRSTLVSAKIMQLGGEAHVLAVSRDLTGVRQAEDTVRKLSRVVEQSPTMVIITDRDGRIEYVNPRFCEVTGYTERSVLGENPCLLKSGEHPDAYYQELWRTIEEGREWRGEFRNRCQDGRLIWVLAVISPIKDDSDRITHFVGIQEDITQRREAEQWLRQAEKMQALGCLAGGIAHDLNNMLVPMMLLTQSTLKDLPTESRGHQDLEKVVDTMTRAKDTVSRVLDFARLEQPRREVLEIGELIGRSMPLLRTLVPRHIAMDVDLDPHAGAVSVDATLIHNALMNLVTNAVDAMGDTGGKVGLEARPTDLSPTDAAAFGNLAAGRYVRVRVTDSGPGIDQQTLSRIFDPFFTTKEPGRGTGLGLSIVQRTMMAHDGAARIDSAPGVGTKVELLFPADGSTSTP